MVEELSRQDLYDLVWSSPIRALAPRFGISDPTLRKACQRSHIPLPAAGYWSKLAAGKAVHRPKLPPRQPGMNATVKPAAGRYDHYSYSRPLDADLLGPLPPRPSFSPDLDEVRRACLARVEKVKVERDLARPHHAIGKYLEVDEQRRISQIGKSYTLSWEAPRFVSPFEQRRLRVLSAFMIGVGRAGGSVRLSGKNARGIYVTVHDTSFWVRLDDEAGVAKEPEEYDPPNKPVGAALVLVIPGSRNDTSSYRWADDKAGKIEGKLKDAAAEMLVYAEQLYRSSCDSQHRWRIERRAHRLEELYRARLKAEQAERERLEQLKQAKIASLLDEAEAYRKAETIRAYVASVKGDVTAKQASEVLQWAEWALEVAADLDPIGSGAFLENYKRMA